MIACFNPVVNIIDDIRKWVGEDSQGLRRGHNSAIGDIVVSGPYSAILIVEL